MKVFSFNCCMESGSRFSFFQCKNQPASKAEQRLTSATELHYRVYTCFLLLEEL